MIVLNDLLGYNLKIYQDTEAFNFSIDSVLIARFLLENINNNNDILDIGTGNAVIPLIIQTEIKNKIIAFEIQQESYELALKNIAYNKVDSVKLINDDIKNIDNYKFSKFDNIICNPPFFKKGSGRASLNVKRKIARYEEELDLESLLLLVKKHMSLKGSFYLVHRTNRLKELLTLLKKKDLSIRKICFVHTKDNEASTMFLCEIKHGLLKEMEVLFPLVINNNDGSYKPNIIKKYFGDNYERKY